MSKTITGTSIHKPFVGFMVNSELSEESKQKVAKVQGQLTQKFGNGIWHQPPESLHITLFDWIAPLIDYGEDKDALFEKIFEQYDKVATEAFRNTQPIEITFNQVKVAPAAVFAVGEDQGQYNQIRQYFLDNIELLPNTKKPPEIIHFTVSRFTEEIEFEPIEAFLQSLDFSMTQEVNSFRLVREEIDPMLKFKTLKEYKLGK